MEIILTRSQQKVFDLLIQKSDLVVSRDEIAQAVWSINWLEKYSDWQIDRLIYLLRNKLPIKYKIKTLRNNGYLLTQSEVSIPKISPAKAAGTIPSFEYLEYMNNPKNQRKTLKDLFKSFTVNNSFKKILIINSYSFDNVDTIYKKFTKNEVYFSNFDKRALKIHSDRIYNLKINNFKVIEDDIRYSIFNNDLFDLVINDFRLNFNTSHKQNLDAVKNMYRVLKLKGKCLVSVVIDPRSNTNRNKPWVFKAQENLTRFCYTEKYYEDLFKNEGFKVVEKFDIENGNKWKPPYRRFLLQK